MLMIRWCTVLHLYLIRPSVSYKLLIRSSKLNATKTKLKLLIFCLLSLFRNTKQTSGNPNWWFSLLHTSYTATGRNLKLKRFLFVQNPILLQPLFRMLWMLSAAEVHHRPWNPHITVCSGWTLSRVLLWVQTFIKLDYLQSSIFQ